jgi:hypothetical protein
MTANGGFSEPPSAQNNQKWIKKDAVELSFARASAIHSA